jgi:hypothetical protein
MDGTSPGLVIATTSPDIGGIPLGTESLYLWTNFSMQVEVVRASTNVSVVGDNYEITWTLCLVFGQRREFVRLLRSAPDFWIQKYNTSTGDDPNEGRDIRTGALLSAFREVASITGGSQVATPLSNRGQLLPPLMEDISDGQEFPFISNDQGVVLPSWVVPVVTEMPPA